MPNEAFKRLMCLGCGFSYDEAIGLPEHGVAPGTRWEDVQADWVCPDCGTPKAPIRDGRHRLRRRRRVADLAARWIHMNSPKSKGTEP